MTPGWRIDHIKIAGHPAVTLRFEAPDAVNGALAAAILAREADLLARSPPHPIAGLQDGLTTRWRDFNVLAWSDPACLRLSEAVTAACEAWLARHTDGGPGNALMAISCWANALREDEKLDVHHHAPAILLGNYLVESGGGEGGATIYFSTDGGIERLPPEPGRLVVCSGAVRHAVERHTGPRPRLSIAFDAFVRRQNPLLYLDAPDAMAAFSGPQWLTPSMPVEETVP